jgi:hypothetical protein
MMQCWDPEVSRLDVHLAADPSVDPVGQPLLGLPLSVGVAVVGTSCPVSTTLLPRITQDCSSLTVCINNQQPKEKMVEVVKK